MLKWTLFLLMLFSLLSCGSSTDEKVTEAILDAQIALGSSDCQHAIDTLEGIGRQNKNAHYLKTLSSAYACRAGFSTPTFFTTDLPVTATPVPLGGTTLYSTSKVSVQTPLENDPTFIDLQTAISILLYAGGLAATTEPTATERAKYFASDAAGDINSQLLYMEMVQLGKLMRVYGNGSASGDKGSGASGNKCFTDYANAPLAVKAAIPSFPGACKVTNDPSSQLASSISPASTRKTRLCQGVVLLNGILDLLPSVLSAATGGSLSAVSGVTTAVSTAKTALLALDPGVGSVLTTINQTNCEDNSIVTVSNIESYYAGLMESIFL